MFTTQETHCTRGSLQRLSGDDLRSTVPKSRVQVAALDVDDVKAPDLQVHLVTGCMHVFGGADARLQQVMLNKGDARLLQQGIDTEVLRVIHLKAEELLARLLHFVRRYRAISTSLLYVHSN